MKQKFLNAISLMGMIGGSLFLIPDLASAQAFIAEDQKSGVEAARLARFRAMIDRDLDVLDELLMEDLTYSHTTGWVESKASLLNTVETGLIDYLSAEPRSVEARHFGEMVVATGLADMRLISSKGEELEFTIRFLEVYKREQGKWRLAAWQSVRNTTQR